MGEDELLVKFVRKEPVPAEMSDDQKKAMIGAIKSKYLMALGIKKDKGGKDGRRKAGGHPHRKRRPV
jgi:hypothetical protein